MKKYKKYKFAFEDVEREVRELAKQFPNTVYTAPNVCSYLRGPAGPGEGCVFGQALAKLGVSPDFLKGYEGITIGTLLNEALASTPLIEQYDWANIVQGSQDFGTPWGSAVARADQSRNA